MVIKVQELKKLLDVNNEELVKIDVEQLRVMLGVFRYLVREVEREINKRCSDQS